MVWFDKILRSLFGTIDGILGWAASTLYTLIVQIANVDIFGNYIYTMMGRIYTFLAIFMLFKLSISVVNYVLNPDQLTDKSKGFGKLIQNVIIVMALIIMTPQIFNWAYKLQAAILNTNVLYTIVTGNPNDSSYDYSDLQGLTSKEIVEKLTANAKDSGDMIKYELLSTFIYNGYSEDEHTAVKSDGTLCNKETKGSYSAAYDCLMDGDTINNTSGSSSDKHYGAKKGFRNEYKILVSTLCIGFAAYVFLVTAFDVALRCVKLGALQLMAPVPIISMLDPNSGKSGMFSKWLKECKNTYLSLFTRLISVYFAVEVIRGLTEPGRFVWYGTDVAVGFGFVKVFVILGLLMFAKQLPKFIEDATGIKMDTGGLNLKKKLDSVPGLNRATAGALGYAGGAAANVIAGIKSGKKPWEVAGSALAGATSGAFRGLTSKEKSPLKAGQGAIKGAVDARNRRLERHELGEHLDDRFKDRVNRFAGITTDDSAKIEAKRALGEDLFKQYDGKTDANGKLSKYSMDGKISEEFGNAWEIMDGAKNYRNKMNEQLSIARNSFNNGDAVSWGSFTGAEAIAQMEIEANKASAAYDKASNDFKDVRSMAAHTSETKYYEAYTAADDRHAAQKYSAKDVVGVTASPSNSASSNSNQTNRPQQNPDYSTHDGAREWDQFDT